MRITAILVPVDEETPISQVTVDDVFELAHIVDGLASSIGIDRPPDTLWVNNNGIAMKLEFNKRGTRLLWVHASRYRGRNTLLGPVIVTGPLDESGMPTSVPEEILELLFNTSSYRVEIQTEENGRWYAGDDRFTTWGEAYDAGLTLALQMMAVIHVRIVPA